MPRYRYRLSTPHGLAEINDALPNGSAVLNTIGSAPAMDIDADAADKADLDAVMADMGWTFDATDPVPAAMSPQAAAGIIDVYRSLVYQKGDFSDAQIAAGFLLDVYTIPGDLPSPPPSGAGNPAMAVVFGGAGVPSLYYWNFVAGTWTVSPPPWNVPFIEPHWLIDQNNGIGTGASTWNFAMGPEIRCDVALEIQDLALKVATGGLDHAWAIRRSTAPGPGAPALNTYTVIEASGIAVATPGNTWTTIGIGSPILGAVNDWFVCQIFPGTSSGQSFNIPGARTAGQLDERLATLNAGTFGSTPGPNPGSTVPPTSRQVNTMYGLCSPFLAEQ